MQWPAQGWKSSESQAYFILAPVSGLQFWHKLELLLLRFGIYGFCILRDDIYKTF